MEQKGNEFKVGAAVIFEQTYPDGSVNHWGRFTLEDEDEPDLAFTYTEVTESYCLHLMKVATLDTDSKEYASDRAIAGRKVYIIDDLRKLTQLATDEGRSNPKAFSHIRNVFPVTRPTDGLYQQLYNRDRVDRKNPSIVHKKGEPVLRNGKPVIVSAITIQVKHRMGADGKFVPRDDVEAQVARILDEGYQKVTPTMGITPAGDIDPTGGDSSAADAVAAAQSALSTP